MVPEEAIQKMLDIINPIMSQQKSRSLEFPVEFTFFHALERINYNIQTLDLLINNDLVIYDHAVGLSCRNLLSDFITISYIVRFSKDIDECYVNLYRLYYTDLKKNESFIDLFTKAGLVTENDKKNIVTKKK